MNNLGADTLVSAAEWTGDALGAVAARYESEEDGALGWASGVEVFAWLVRVVGLADVVLRSGGKVVGEKRTGVKMGLARVAGAMRRGGAHGGVVERVEKVLEEDVLRGLGAVSSVAREAPGYAGSWIV